MLSYAPKAGALCFGYFLWRKLMAKSKTQYGQPANYNVTPATRSDGQGSALEVDANGNLKTISAGTVSGVGSGVNTAAVTSVADTASSTTLIAANTAAKERIIQNDSSSILYVKFGTTASASDYTMKLSTDDVLTTAYTGRIDGIWSADSTGAAKITELS